ncbi:MULTISPECIES: hypothetical protein [unclassified Moorena]|uniref:hypothetical protein n=1 Tax=unclassified Moorena TaxID=2683338 RepID=UPI0013B6DA5C|nr:MULTISPECIES: hypothetical protein [unclassified Moorena]NEQ18033.1 hypothetical protein [Moorena sp. SIO3E2]NEP65465.1 hypothetical protein [Moorena sp. SIO3A5]NEQ06589.1 hypothetical protein [Moorena sp. SIO4E2]NER85667.1 hypothetical protein [Moorena sp. SIO3A2]NES44371.1 hypothetical protein [Moorena sp. SIO2C4]
MYPSKLIFLWHCPPYICSIVIHPLVGSAYLGVPKQINLSVALPTLHLLPIPDSRFPIPDSRFPIPSAAYQTLPEFIG